MVLNCVICVVWCGVLCDFGVELFSVMCSGGVVWFCLEIAMELCCIVWCGVVWRGVVMCGFVWCSVA